MKITFIGGGHMAAALLAGLAARGGCRCHVIERNADKRRRLAQDFGVTAGEADDGGGDADAVVLAVRPPDALAACALPAAQGAPLISVVAGLRLDALAARLRHKRLIRAMPNTPAQAGIGMTFLCAAADAAADERRLAEDIFAAVGKTAWLDDEAQLDIVTAVSGSGPAYVYYFIEAMRAAAVRLGLAEAEALPAILQTVRGAAAMVEQDGDAAKLCAAVAAKGGTTERALAVLDERRWAETLEAAMRACAARAREIGDELPAVKDGE